MKNKRTVAKVALIILAIGAISAEIWFLNWYAPSMGPEEWLGAPFLFLGTVVVVATLWHAVARPRRRYYAHGCAIAIAFWLFLMAYAMLMHW